MIVKQLVIDYFQQYFELPEVFVIPEANLYTLSVLSLFFAKDAGYQTIKFNDIEQQKLSLGIKEMEHRLENNVLKIYMNKLLKIPQEKMIYYQDEVGSDGFSEHLLHLSICLMELPEKLNIKNIDDSGLDDVNTVQEVIDIVSTSKDFSLN